MPGKLPRPVADIDAEIGIALRRGVDQALRISAVGAPDTVRRHLSDLVAKYRPDEVILTGQIHDHEARKRSFTIAAEALQEVAVAA
jgi:alkanesulfonate monooxygenase SsuD/methylene tetrahydromethanopterin reductase-like flavin-dependent oxidoreductase (luciferase family)